MNKNATPLILIILSIGIYFTFTRVKIDEVRAVTAVNNEYKTALKNSEALIKKRDEVLAIYNKIDPEDQERLEKMVPDNVDNVRLIIDLNGVAARHNISIKNVKTSTVNKDSSKSGDTGYVSNGEYNTVTMSFDLTTSYQTFQNFLRDLEASLRIMEISKISLKAGESGNFDYGVEVKTFWLKQ